MKSKSGAYEKVEQDGFSVLGKALLEHNIEVISKIYKNITFSELGRFLQIDASQGEQIISEMVEEGRISGELDQRRECITFNTGERQKG